MNKGLIARELAIDITLFCEEYDVSGFCEVLENDFEGNTLTFINNTIRLLTTGKKENILDYLNECKKEINDNLGIYKTLCDLIERVENF